MFKATEMYVDIVTNNVQNDEKLSPYRNYQRSKQTKKMYVDIVIINVQNDRKLFRNRDYQSTKQRKCMSIT